jgi:membrane protease YdiL (CAAX protease family)
MTRLNACVSRHPVAAYFALTFVISWGGALLAIGNLTGMQGTTPGSDPRFPFAVMAMLAGPSVSGILLTALVSGRAGLRTFLSRVRTWRVGAIWYAVAILTAPILMLATLLVLSFTSSEFLPGIFTSNQKGSLLLVGLNVGLAAGIFEELGWTGFAIPAMRRWHGVLATGFTVGVWWSAWHLLPNLWAARAAAGDLPVSIHLTGIVAGVFVGYLTAFRVLMAWVYERTGSVFLGMLMHISFTSSLLILNPLGIAGANLATFSFALAGAIWLVVAAVVIVPGRIPRATRSADLAAN